MRFVMVLVLLAGCSTSESIASSNTSEPTPSPTATLQPTADAGLAGACAALVEMRQTGTLVTIAGKALTGDYTTDWTPAANALLDQMGSALAAIQPIPNDGRYRSWKQEALKVIVELSTVVERWEAGMAGRDADAINDGTVRLATATGYVAAMNGYASAFEADC